MFESRTTQNGVPIDWNSNDESGYEHPASRWRVSGDVSRAVQTQVFGQIGSKRGTMSFDSLLDGERR